MTPHAILASAKTVGRLSDLQKLRPQLYGVTGVYALYCVTSGNYYIGSSYNVYTRVSDYLQLSYQANRSTHPIIRSLIKHGVDNFLVLLLEETTVSNVRWAEQQAINLYAPAYNQLSFVDNSTGFKHTEATKELLRTKKLGSTRSEESRTKQSETIKGKGNHRFGKSLTQEQKDLLRTIALNRAKPNKPCDAVVVEHTETGVSNTYRSVRQAALNEPYSRLALTAVLKGTRVIEGLHVYYAPKDE